MPFVQFFVKLALLILWSAAATISWLMVRKDLALRPGRDLRFIGTVLIILAVAAVWLFLLSVNQFPFSQAASVAILIAAKAEYAKLK